MIMAFYDILQLNNEAMNSIKCIKILTSVKLRDKVALNPFFFGSLLSSGIKQPLKAPGSDWKRDLSIPSVRIWNG